VVFCEEMPPKKQAAAQSKVRNESRDDVETKREREKQREKRGKKKDFLLFSYRSLVVEMKGETGSEEESG
jgi:hypothetical protein